MSTSTEEYLESLYTLTQNDQIASTSTISKRLNVAPASVTDMLKKLADKGYVKYSRYQGVTLTSEGLKIASKMTRKHRLLERFLHDILHIGNDKVHWQACAMEHGLADDAERALCQTLRAPGKCPDDGEIIPPCDLGFTSCKECKQWGIDRFDEISKRGCNIIAVSSMKEKQQGKVAFIRGDNKALRRLLDMGLTPGTKISISRIAPLKGPVEIAVRGSRLALGDDVACNVFIEKSRT